MTQCFTFWSIKQEAHGLDKNKDMLLCVFRTGMVTMAKDLGAGGGGRRGVLNARQGNCVNCLALSHISALLKSKRREPP